MPQVTNKNVSFPNIEPWEEFLDFSRWRTPATSVIMKRLIENALTYSVRVSMSRNLCSVYTFSICVQNRLPNLLLHNNSQGNYLWMWFVITLLWGLMVNWLIIGSFFAIAASCKASEILYRNACQAETKDGRLGKCNRLEKDVSLPSSAKV